MTCERNPEMAVVEDYLLDFLSRVPAALGQGMRYALFPGGRRLRPAVVLQLGQAMRVAAAKLVAGAAAVEMIHGYSLVHDDLPELDGDLLRRGLPSVHRAFGHAQGLLIGDALQCGAFQLLMQTRDLEDHERCLVTQELATAAMAMAAGQYQELSLQHNCDEETLLGMYAGKTGALFGASWTIPAIMSGRLERMEAFRRHGVDFGVAFQLLDDLHDLPVDQRKGMASHPILFGSNATNARLGDLMERCRQFLANHGMQSVLDELLGLIT